MLPLTDAVRNIVWKKCAKFTIIELEHDEISNTFLMNTLIMQSSRNIVAHTRKTVLCHQIWSFMAISSLFSLFNFIFDQLKSKKEKVQINVSKHPYCCYNLYIVQSTITTRIPMSAIIEYHIPMFALSPIVIAIGQVKKKKS